jgi:hypothetical protein
MALGLIGDTRSAQPAVEHYRTVGTAADHL